MIKKVIFVISMVGTACAANKRTWTSADGTKSFEAEFKSIAGNVVTVIKDGEDRSMNLKFLSEADREWLLAIRQQQALREWTSADGKKKFMAELVYADTTSATFVKQEKPIKIEQKILSEADVTWIRNNKDKVRQERLNSGKAAFYEPLWGNTEILKGDKMVPSDLKGDSEFYILYFTASW